MVASKYAFLKSSFMTTEQLLSEVINLLQSFISIGHGVTEKSRRAHLDESYSLITVRQRFEIRDTSTQSIQNELHLH
jgi:hypothetical protein